MHPAVFTNFSLFATSLMLTAILAIAWTSFGRPRHALIWAGAFAVAALEWLANLLVLAGWLGDLPGRLFATTAGTLVVTLLLIGFRKRAELKPRWGRISAMALASASIAIWAALATRGGMVDRCALSLYIAVTLTWSATTLVRGWRTNATERATFIAFLCFAAFYVMVGAVAVFVDGRALPGSVSNYRTLLLLGTPVIFTSVGLFVVFLLAADLAERMRRLAMLDPLTGIMNRRGLAQFAEQAIANAHRRGRPLSLVLADLDRFKEINDNHGHAAGDLALQRFAAYLESAIRKGDVVSRIGGEEFALLLVDSPSDMAMEVAERLREGLAELDSGTEGVRLGSSFGVTSLHLDDQTLEDIMNRADSALYCSKLGGRDRVTLAATPPSASAHGAQAGRLIGQPLPAPLR